MRNLLDLKLDRFVTYIAMALLLIASINKRWRHSSQVNEDPEKFALSLQPDGIWKQIPLLDVPN